jgi:hypothetical protein
MSSTMKPSALKHGAFSKLHFLPGEDPQEFEDLKARLFAEYKPSGGSEEETLESIAEVIWRERRLGIYQHVQYLRGRRSGRAGYRGPTNALMDPLARSLANCASAARTGGRPDPAEVEQILKDEEAAAELTIYDDDRLLELGNVLTLDHLNKELDVQNKLQSMIDRLFKRYWQIRAMKPLAGLGNSQPVQIGETPLLELSPGDAPKMLELNGEAPAEAAATDLVKSEEE